MKRFEQYGIARAENILREAEYANVAVERVARGYTYNTNDNQFPSTRLDMVENPFVNEVKAAKNILEIGCGVGRNLPWIYENTDAIYWGVDPNPVMLDSFWKITDKKYDDRTILMTDLCDIPIATTFDVVLSVFVFQHLGYRAPEGVMNVTDITQEIMKNTRSGTVWIVYEHEGEELWQARWFSENRIQPDVYIRNYRGLPELLDRGDGSHLIIWRQQ